MELLLFNKSLEKEYNEFLDLYSDATCYATLKYKNFLKEILNCDEEYYVVMDNNKIIGVLPLLKKSGKYGDVYNSLPFFGSHGGILTTNQKAYDLLLNKIDEISSKQSTLSFVFLSYFQQNLNVNIKLDATDTRIGFVTDIQDIKNFEDIKHFHSATRRNIKKAIKNGVIVYIDNSMKEFLKSVHKQNIEAIGGKVRDDAFFDLLDTHFCAGEDYDIYVAKKDNKLIAACLLFYFGKNVEYMVPVIVNDYRTYQPLSLIIFESMCNLSKKGYRYWYWGGTWLSQKGVYNFKKKWASNEFYYYYYIKVNKKIYTLSKKDIENEYNNFYLIPYDRLKKESYEFNCCSTSR
jgi:hypothetical protein